MASNPFYLSPEARAALRAEAAKMRARLAERRAAREFNDMLARVLAKPAKGGA